jgi:hypothetical protein
MMRGNTFIFLLTREKYYHYHKVIPSLFFLTLQVKAKGKTKRFSKKVFDIYK